MTADLFDFAEARAERDKALRHFEDSQPSFLAQARSLAITIAQQDGRVTIDDVRARLPLPEGIHPNVFGAVFKGKLFEPIGYVPSQRKAAHARAIRVYRLASSARSASHA